MRQDGVIGRTLGGYLIEALIGRGGMGRVYRAQQLSVKRSVALKLLSMEHAENDEFRSRFLAESQLAATIEHPNILPVYDAGEIDGYLYIAMRYVEGTDLRTVLERERRLSVERTLHLLTQAALALDAAHAEGLVHRDVKPANLLLAGEHVYLADFGVAKVAAARRELTRTGIFVGTLDYAAPEQIRNEPLDGRADLYALGCVLFHCLTGAPPFDRPSEYATMQAHLYDPPPAPTRLRPDLPTAMDGMIATALAKMPDERFRTARHFLQALREAGTPAGDAPPVPLLDSRPSRLHEAAESPPMADLQHARSAVPATAKYVIASVGTSGFGAASARAGVTSTAAASRSPAPTAEPHGGANTVERLVVSVGLLTGLAALAVPQWTVEWTTTLQATGADAAFPGAVPGLVVGFALVAGGIVSSLRGFGWPGLAIAASTTLWAYGFGPLLSEASTFPAPGRTLGWGFWLAVISFVVIAFGLSLRQPTWARATGLGLFLVAAGAASPAWAVMFLSASGVRNTRAFDPPNQEWAIVLAGGCAAVALALLFRVMIARTQGGGRTAIAITAGALSWLGLAVAITAHVWWLGLNRLATLAEAREDAFLLLGEGFWLTAAGLVIVAMGFVLEITSAEPTSSGRWNTVARLIAPSTVRRIR